MQHAPGDVFLDKYELLDTIGVGAFGTVLLARHSTLGHAHAIKFLRADKCGDATVDRFQREIAALADIEHANVVRAFDAGTDGDDAYIVMEFVDGVPLSDLARASRLSIETVVEVSRQICSGLGAIHALGRTHRDLKPSNIMVSRDGVVKLLDLGLAKLRSELAGGVTATGEVMGTPDFMAPEQWEDSSSVDIRADIYSLGCTVYYLLSGGPPFGGPSYDSAPRKMRGHLMDAPDRIERDDCPAELQAILEKALSKSPDDRYGTPEEFANALAPFRGPTDVPTLVNDVLPEDESVLSRIDFSLRSSARGASQSTFVKHKHREQAVAGQQLADLISDDSLPAAPRSRTRDRKRLWLVLGPVLVAAMAFVVPQIRRVVLNKGTIEIVYPEPGLDVRVAVLKNGEKIRVVSGDDVAELSVGTYGLRLETGPPGLELEAQTITLRRGGQALITLTFDPSEPPDKAPYRPMTEHDFATVVLLCGGVVWIDTPSGDRYVDREEDLPIECPVTTIHLPKESRNHPLLLRLAHQCEVADQLRAVLIDHDDFDWAAAVPALNRLSALRIRAVLGDDIKQSHRTLDALDDLSTIRDLNLQSSYTRVPGRVIVDHLVKLKKLTSLSLAQVGLEGRLLTDADICRLVEELTRLQKLTIGFNNGFGKSALEAISKLPNLTELRCERSNVDDSCLQAILNMKQLNVLNVERTRMSLKALRTLRAARPGLLLLCDFSDRQLNATAEVIAAPEPEWSLERPAHDLRHPAEVTKVCVVGDPRQRIVAGGKNGHVLIWDAASGALLETLEEHAAVIRAVWSSSDRQRVVTADSSGRLLVWSPKDWTIEFQMELETDIWDAKFVGSDVVLVSSSDGRLRRVDLRNKQVRLGPLIGGGPILREVSVIDESRAVVVATDGVAYLVDTDSLEVRNSQQICPRNLTSAVALESNRVVIGAWSGQVVSWDPGTRKITSLTETLAIECAAASADGTRVFVGTMYDVGWVLEPASDKPLQLDGAHKGAIVDASFIDRNTLVTVGFDKAVRVWRLPPAGETDRDEDQNKP